MSGRRRQRETAIFIARQAMFDRNGRVFGYELLSRESGTDASVASEMADATAATHATGTLLVRTLADFGLDRLVGKRPAFINVTKDFLASGMHELLPADRVFLELNARQIGWDDPELLPVITAARRKGYRVGLDAISPTTWQPALASKMDYVKVDVIADRLTATLTLAAEAKQLGIVVCAQRVETTEQFEACNAKFDLFQGYFYQRPVVIEGATLSTSRLATVQLLAECSNPEATLETFEKIIGRDPGLTYRVLQLANSGFAALPRRIDSLREALVMVGVTNVRNLAMFASLNRLEDRTPELLTTVLVRAKMCEQIAGRLGVKPSTAFTAGLLSLLDTFVGLSLVEAIEKVNLTPDLKAAILEHTGPLGEILETAIACERGTFVESADAIVSMSSAAAAYLAAVEWAEGLTVTAA